MKLSPPPPKALSKEAVKPPSPAAASPDPPAAKNDAGAEAEELGSDNGADLQSGAAVAPPDEKKPDSGSPNDAVEPMALRALSCLTPG